MSQITTLESAGQLAPYSRFRKWKPVSRVELWGFIALIVNMCIIQLPDIESYWKTSWVSQVPFFRDVLPRDRFQEIFWLLRVGAALSKESGRKRQEYQKVSTEMKSKIAKYAAENSVKAAVKRFKDQVPNAPQNWKNTVRDWKDTYLRELRRKRSAGDLSDVLLPKKKMGRPLLLGDELDKQVQEYIKSLRSGHAVVNTAIVLGVAEGIVKGHGPSLLSCNEGPIELTRDWAKSVMKQMGLTKRKATTKSTLSQYNDVSSIAVMEEIPQPLIINWDQTGTHFVPVSERTMEVKGSERI